MTIELSIQEETSTPNGASESLEEAAKALFKHLEISSAELSILLADDEVIRDLNHRFRGIDKTTDVLSFPAGNEFSDLEIMANYLGDIAISIPYARRQSSARGHGETAELQLLTIHGILHLLGYDHVEAGEKTAMWSVQRTVLKTLGLEDVVPTEE